MKQLFGSCLKLSPTQQAAEKTVAQLPAEKGVILFADAADRPVLIDFYADWCIPCKELDKITFADPTVQAALADYVLLKVDLTQDKSEKASMLKKRYAIKGVPTIIFLDGDGNEESGRRLTGFEAPDAFLLRLQ